MQADSENTQFWRVFLVAVLVNPCLCFLLNWLPTYFSQQWGVAPAGLKGILTLIFLGLDLGYLFCGIDILSLTRRGRRLASARQMVFLYRNDPVESDGACSLCSGSEYGGGPACARELRRWRCWIAMYLTMAQEVSATNLSTAASLLGGSGSLAGL